ncbi:glycosyltransferase [Parabacteroides sp. ZJ-118]|uniref:glycosyltransferase n=1 Tax=Parabacteroides sp. ZJ-118 TaxID=2709398 RepID=UPI0013E9BB52|nr:glycosyltransferase [Parabacteroides sp. ZJ-118]
MRILFISSLYSSVSKAYFADNCAHGASLLNQVDAFQWAILEGLIKNDTDFSVVSFPALGTFPFHFKKCIVPESDVVYEDKSYGLSLKYSALPVYKEWNIQKRLKKYVKKWIAGVNCTTNEPLVALVYTSAAMFVEPLVQLKCVYPNLHICCVITDLIDDAMNFNSNRFFLKHIQIVIEKRRQKKLYKNIDYFVLLSKAMEEKIPEAIGNNIVIEGIYGQHELSFVENRQKEEKLKQILYGGTLEEFSGIKDLVDAFMLLKNVNYRLVICGSGFCETYIKECAQKDNRIDYRGMILRSDFLLLQKEATLLVNPRKPTEAITRFSFPSKTIEYLSSGTPMLGYKLEGIPCEYYDYFYTVNDLTICGLADRLQEVLSLPDEDRSLMAEHARTFIYQHKTAEHQIGRLLNFLNSRLA